eukprot:TRINITY_DN2268_c0_g2_i1.p1 TRINITY_DN2268_c0_g2~~TRINITY_DN2268_c0_g2_i1.p1  ORF type:complete len:322 (-),score=94.96 TRINITY_DN2268_c0_g2_i1:127-1092(-)
MSTLITTQSQLGCICCHPTDEDSYLLVKKRYTSAYHKLCYVLQESDGSERCCCGDCRWLYPVISKEEMKDVVVAVLLEVMHWNGYPGVRYRTMHNEAYRLAQSAFRKGEHWNAVMKIPTCWVRHDDDHEVVGEGEMKEIGLHNVGSNLRKMSRLIEKRPSSRIALQRQSPIYIFPKSMYVDSEVAKEEKAFSILEEKAGILKKDVARVVQEHEGDKGEGKGEGKKERQKQKQCVGRSYFLPTRHVSLVSCRLHETFEHAQDKEWDVHSEVIDHARWFSLRDLMTLSAFTSFGKCLRVMEGDREIDIVDLIKAIKRPTLQSA